MKNDGKKFPKFFQIGTVMESKTGIPDKVAVKGTMAEQFLNDDKAERHTYKNFNEITSKRR